MNIDELAYNSGVYIVLVEKQSPQKVAALRREYKKKGCSLTTNLDKNIYDTHHKIGLSLGGTNSPDNLVLMLRHQHEILHRDYIDPQVKDMKVGEQRYIILPKAYRFDAGFFEIYRNVFIGWQLRNDVLKNERGR